MIQISSPFPPSPLRSRRALVFARLHSCHILSMNQENNYAFIDGQNLYLAIKKLGWKLDYKKFRVYLKEKLKVVMAPSLENCSTLLKRVSGKKIVLGSDLRGKLEYI